jgi:Fic family protein
MAALAVPLAKASRAQGVLLGRLADIGLAQRDQVSLTALTDDVVKTSEIEGEHLNVASVRSSLARRLGVEIGALAPSDRHVDGVVDMVLDATTRADEPLSLERLFAWHAALFPTARSGLNTIRVGALRNDADGPMQVVSGPIGRQRVHFQAPPAQRLGVEMRGFLRWANAEDDIQPLFKAGLAHLWFVTLHPFDDGNGRIARAVGDLFLARADGMSQRVYSLSAQIQRERRGYYEILERAQKGSLDVTAWLEWFLLQFERAVTRAQDGFDQVLAKARFWRQWTDHAFNARQIKVLNKALDGLEGKLTSSRWAALAKCSPDSALRDITDLIERGVLVKSGSGGRSTSYDLA